MFSECQNLTIIPDISKWDTFNIIYANKIFSGCSSLTTLPVLSKWGFNNLKNINQILSSFPYSSVNNYEKNLIKANNSSKSNIFTSIYSSDNKEDFFKKNLGNFNNNYEIFESLNDKNLLDYYDNFYL